MSFKYKLDSSKVVKSLSKANSNITAFPTQNAVRVYSNKYSSDIKYRTVDKKFLLRRWIAQQNPLGVTAEGVCWSPKLGLFLLVGNSNSFAYSSDGIKWTLTSNGIPAGYYWSGIAWSEELNLFLVVSHNSNYIVTSSDGINWTSYTDGSSSSTAMWVKELGKFYTISGSYCTYSSDGINWTKVFTTGDGGGSKCWSPQLGIFLSCMFNTSITSTSPDGIVWTSSAITYNGWSHPAWSPKLGVFVLTCYYSPYIVYSTNGTSWTNANVPSIITGALQGIMWVPEMEVFISPGFGAPYYLISKDGINWSCNLLPDISGISSICWSPELGKLCTSGSGNNRNIYTSIGFNGY